MNKKRLINILLIVVVVALVGTGVYIYSTRQPLPIVTSSSSPTPTSIPSGEKIIKKVGEQESSFLIQKINSESVDGLWYEAYPVARKEGVPKTLRIGDDIGYACEGISEKLTSINFSNQKVVFTKVVGKQPYGGCPI